jgi:CBS domain-containing protein
MSVPMSDAVGVRPELYLSQVLGRAVFDAAGERIARVRDLLVQFGSEPHPPVSGIVAGVGGREFFVDRAQVAEISAQGVRLATFKVDLRPFERREGEVLLRRDILDKQLIDVDGRRLVRANDLELAELGGQYRLVGVDVSAQALLRRLGPAALTGAIKASRVIDWEDVESFATDVPMVRLRSSHQGLAKLHPVEIAHIVESLSPRQAQEVLDSLDDETVADTIQELPAEDAAQMIQGLDRERAADILDEMDPDDAADLLGDLPAEHAAELLDLMEPDESEDVRELLTYQEDTAAGLMTTDYVVLPARLSAGEALARVRALAEPPDPLYHLYLVDDETSEHLVGVLPLRDLVLAEPQAPVTELAWLDFQSARADESPRTVAQRMAEYNLAALPVVDEAGSLLGVILVDDAIEVLVPELWKRRRAGLFG